MPVYAMSGNAGDEARAKDFAEYATIEEAKAAVAGCYAAVVVSEKPYSGQSLLELSSNVLLVYITRTGWYVPQDLSNWYTIWRV